MNYVLNKYAFLQNYFYNKITHCIFVLIVLNQIFDKLKLIIHNIYYWQYYYKCAVYEISQS